MQVNIGIFVGNIRNQDQYFTYINDTLLYLYGNGVFGSLSNLLELQIPDFITTISESASVKCTYLVDIDLNKVTVINKNALFDCPIKKIIIGNGVLIEPHIGTTGLNYGFRACYIANESTAGTYIFNAGTWSKL